MQAFFKPMIKGKDNLTCPAFSFLIEHSSGKRFLFDLGTRKDWETLPPTVVNRIKGFGANISIEKNVAEILQEHNVDVANGAIDSVMWSHHHWDHVGDMRTFPQSTGLIVGPGFQKQYLPGYPENEDSPVLAEDFRDHPVREIDIAAEGKGLKIGRFNAYDYFDDGSFYLLDTPGHSVGHMCGLARTTAGKDPSFVFMAGDACHHGGEFRPSEYSPLPSELKPPTVKRFGPICPGHALVEMHRSKDPTKPFYQVQEKFPHDLQKCNWTIDGLMEFDAHPNVLMLMAHDETVLDILDLYPKQLNDWKEKDVATKAKWRFIDDFSEAVPQK